MNSTTNEDTSGIWSGEAHVQSTSPDFTDCSVMQSDGFSLLVKAKRNGRWWMLKGIKKEHREDPIYEELLVKEFSILCQLQHPYIVQVVDMDDIEPYGRCIIMEYVDGVTLEEFLQTNTTKSERQRIVELLIDAIEYIHSKQVVHRDLKPGNILVTHNGKNLKVIDFGLSDTDSHTVLKQPAGTIRYMSPEQRNNNTPDVRNDIYSLGVIMKQMRLGWKYRYPAWKCTRSISRRYRNVAEIRSAVKRFSRICTIVITLVFICSCCMIAAVYWPQNGSTKVVSNASELNALRKMESELRLSHQKDSLLIRQMKDSLSRYSKIEAARTSREAMILQIHQQWEHIVAGEIRKCDAVNSESLTIIVSLADILEKQKDKFYKKYKDELSLEEQNSLASFLEIEKTKQLKELSEIWKKKHLQTY